MCYTMLIPFVLSVVIWNIAWASPHVPKSYQNYYSWRDFEGAIPDDALQAGKDRLGKPIYIGQAMYENKLIPGKIYENENHIYFEWNGKEYAQQKNVKILCSQTPHQFEWVATESQKVVLLTNTFVVKGGYEGPNYSIYLGRALVDGETLVGKVVCSADNCLGMYTTSSGVAKHIQKFEVLTINSENTEAFVFARLNE